MKYASFGSISHGTLREEDLLATFASELEYHVQRNADAWCSDDGCSQRGAYLRLVHGARELDAEQDCGADYVHDLMDALQDFAPPYAYFGAHEGDGSNFGYWLSDSMQEDFDGLQVDDTSEVPDDYDGEVLHVNDHGNMTLYVASAGELTEIWGVV